MFLVAPGVWRNICPLAASNQTPRALGHHQGADRRPHGSRSTATSIAISLFIGFVFLRKLGLDDSGPL